MEVVDSVILSQLIKNFEARLGKIFKQLKLLRFPVECGHRCLERLWQFGNSVDNIMEIRRIFVVCHLLKGQQNLLSFDRRRSLFTADLWLASRAVPFLLFS